MPPVRGADPTPAVADIPGVGGLSRVRADNSDGKTQEVPPALEKVAKRKLEPRREVVDMTLDEKLAILNAFRAIRNKVPKVRDPKTQDLIQLLYYKWIDETMLQILNAGATPTANFNSQEVGALKVLAQTILQRQQGSAGPAPVPMVPRTGAAKPLQHEPAPTGVDDEKLRKAQLNFLQELSKMEREGPSY